MTKADRHLSLTSIPLGGITPVADSRKVSIMVNPDHKEGNLNALRRIEGQVRGIQRMIEQRKYCVDILTQISAIKGALGKVENRILQKHLENCVIDSMKGTCEEDTQEKIDEVFKLILCMKKV